jgi:signal transduction histidine kinase
VARARLRGWSPARLAGQEWQWPPVPPFVLAAVLAVVQVGGSFGAAQNQPDREPLDAFAVLLLLAGPAALVLRRRFPVPVLLVVGPVTVTYLLSGYPYGPVVFSLVVALFTAVVRGHRVAAWLTASVLYAGHLALGRMVDSDMGSLMVAVVVAAWLLVVLVLAEAARVQRARIMEARRTREEEARRRASEERLRIAQELHDVLAHNISLINVQAGVALHLMDDDPGQARTALTAIKQASKDALGELRSVLGVLRRLDEQAPRQPAPGLARLDELAGRAGAAGLRVRTEVAGEPRPLPAAVDLAAFRVVQESLTNVARHAGAAHVTVHVTYRDDDLVVRVDDDGAGAPTASSPGTGSGILGMRERATALGGELVAGPRPGGGFRVVARLPLGGRENGSEPVGSG